MDLLKDYLRPHNKIRELEKKNMLTPVKRGLYIAGPALNVRTPSLYVLANHIYGPSYVSLEAAPSALRIFHGLDRFSEALRAKDSNNRDSESISKEDFNKLLDDKINSVSMERVKEDVLPFIKDYTKLDIWSRQYFRDISKLIRFTE